VVASSPLVSCNVMIVDNGVNPPVSLATLGTGVRLAPGAMLATVALPQFADAQMATHAAVIPGVIKKDPLDTDIFCTSLAAQPIDLGVELLGPEGTVRNSVAAGNGAVLNVAPGATVHLRYHRDTGLPGECGGHYYGGSPGSGTDRQHLR